MSLSVSLFHKAKHFKLDIEFSASQGITVLFGQSGTGKTTVINSIAGLFRPQKSNIQLNEELLQSSHSGKFIPAHKRRLGYVFQEGRLFPHLTIQQNLEYGLRIAPNNAKGPNTEEIAELLGIKFLFKRYPRTLSGGEKQRVAIGRALLSRPKMLLMDEPLASLDDSRKAEILPYLEQLRDQFALPILYVSHSVSEVARLATTIVVLESGKTVCSGPANMILSNPNLVHQIGIRNAGALISARVIAHHLDGVSELETSGGHLFIPLVNTNVGSLTRIRILAQDIILSRDFPLKISALNVLPVQVSAVRKGTGPGFFVQIKSGTDHLLARVTQRSARNLEIEIGKKFYAIIKTVSIAQTDIGIDQ
ncbi:MAG: molybdenum ABC transporter ATP-binding protein [Aestuariivita sp.]|nr:molybdenum ABC transporter ATP-binding protein [Aestuariivita sp.]